MNFNFLTFLTINESLFS